jgi:NitT/TauT family transport system permease protein
MAKQNQTAETLLDIKVAEASRFYKFYLNYEKHILGISAVIIFFVVWELVGNVWKLVNPLFVSAPSLIWKAGVQLFVSGEIWHHLRVSGVEFFWGYLLSIGVGIPFGIALGWYKRVAYILDPFVGALYATPRISLLPLIIIWLGIGLISKVTLVFLGAVFPVLINTRDGVKTTPNSLLNASRSFGASQWQIFRTVVFPSTIPFILSGLRLAVGRALIGVFVAELFAAQAGIGHLITIAGTTYQTDKVFVGVFIFALSGIVLMELIGRVEKRFDIWRPKVGAAE